MPPRHNNEQSNQWLKEAINITSHYYSLLLETPMRLVAWFDGQAMLQNYDQHKRYNGSSDISTYYLAQIQLPSPFRIVADNIVVNEKQCNDTTLSFKVQCHTVAVNDPVGVQPDFFEHSFVIRKYAPSVWRIVESLSKKTGVHPAFKANEEAAKKKKLEEEEAAKRPPEPAKPNWFEMTPELFGEKKGDDDLEDLDLPQQQQQQNATTTTAPPPPAYGEQATKPPPPAFDEFEVQRQNKQKQEEAQAADAVAAAALKAQQEAADKAAAAIAAAAAEEEKKKKEKEEEEKKKTAEAAAAAKAKADADAAAAAAAAELEAAKLQEEAASASAQPVAESEEKEQQQQPAESGEKKPWAALFGKTPAPKPAGKPAVATTATTTPPSTTEKKSDDKKKDSSATPAVAAKKTEEPVKKTEVPPVKTSSTTTASTTKTSSVVATPPATSSAKGTPRLAATTTAEETNTTSTTAVVEQAPPKPAVKAWGNAASSVDILRQGPAKPNDAPVAVVAAVIKDDAAAAAAAKKKANTAASGTAAAAAKDSATAESKAAEARAKKDENLADSVEHFDLFIRGLNENCTVDDVFEALKPWGVSKNKIKIDKKPSKRDDGFVYLCFCAFNSDVTRAEKDKRAKEMHESDIRVRGVRARVEQAKDKEIFAQNK
jgi:hypothetical protein